MRVPKSDTAVKNMARQNTCNLSYSLSLPRSLSFSSLSHPILSLILSSYPLPYLPLFYEKMKRRIRQVESAIRLKSRMGIH
jgi:hypothetical protein